MGLAADDGDTGRASLNKGRHSADTQTTTKKTDEGQLKGIKGISLPPLIHRSAFRAAAEMSVRHEGGEGKHTIIHTDAERENILMKKIKRQIHANAGLGLLI